MPLSFLYPGAHRLQRWLPAQVLAAVVVAVMMLAACSSEQNDATVAQLPDAVTEQPTYASFEPSQYPNNERMAWDAPAPGMTIYLRNPVTDDSTVCTLATFVRRSGHMYAVTAGHCVGGSITPRTDVTYRVAGDPTPLHLGTAEAWHTPGFLAEYADFAPNSDIAMIRVDDAVVPALDLRIARELTITSVMKREDVVVGMEVCTYGFRTEETCGTVVGSDGVMVEANLFSLYGDSGSALYTYTDRQRREVAIIGVLSGSPQGNDSLARFTLLGPVLEALATA